MQLVFATNNKHKLKEARLILPAGIEVIGLQEIGCTDELPETGTTLEQNSRQKATYVHEKFGVDCFADDTGLEVKVLGNRPGAFSARYAGPACRSEDNIRKLLIEVNMFEDRKARFRTVITLMLGDELFRFEGVVQGMIAGEPRGVNGFGYDAVFIPDGSMLTFAEMNESEKNKLSHRGEAIRALAIWLENRFR